MGLRINQNIAAIDAYRSLSVTGGQIANSRAAGLSAAEGLQARVEGMKVAVRNARDSIAVVKIAEGAMNEVHSILGRMRDLAVQAASSGSQDTDAQTELTQLNAELDRISSTNRVGSVHLIGALVVSFNGISSSILGIASLDLVNSASSAVTALETAIQTVSTNRANLGAVQNRLEHTISNLSVAAENLSASESRIRATDMADQAPQQVLQLLRA